MLNLYQRREVVSWPIALPYFVSISEMREKFAPFRVEKN